MINRFIPTDFYNAIIVIDEFDALMNKGEVFDFSAENLALSYTSSLTVLVSTGNKNVMIALSAEASGGQIELNVYEDSVATSGSAISCFSRNRSLKNDNGSLTKVFKNPVVSDPGYQFVHKHILSGEGQGKSSINASITPGLKRIYNKNTNYVLDFKNDSSGTTAIVTFDASFSEVEDIA